MTLVTPDDLKQYMSNLNMSVKQKNAAALLLEGLQAELEMYINRTIEARFIRETVMTNLVGYAYLSQSPISKVFGVVVLEDGLLPDMLPTTEYLPGTFPDGVEDLPQYDLVPADFGKNLIGPGGLYLGSPSAWFVIDYQGGGDDFMAPYIPAIKNALLRVGSREFQHMHDDSVMLGEQGASPPVDNIPPSGRGWQERELRQFDRIRRRVIA